MAGTWVGWSTAGRRGWETRLYGRDLVITDILNRLFTMPGERVMRPEWGSAVLPTLMAPDDDIQRNEIARSVLEVLQSDPRIEPINVGVSGPPGMLVAHMMFRIRGHDETEELRVAFREENGHLVPARVEEPDVGQ